MGLSSWLASLVSKGKQAEAAGRPVAPGKLFGPYALFNIIALGGVIAAGAYIGSEYRPKLPDTNKALNRLRKGEGGEGGPA